MDAADLLELMRSRRSIRHFQDRPVPPETLARLLEAARWAPSAHNRQPWRFAVIADPVRRAGLARAMGEQLRADLQADGLAADEIDRQIDRSQERIGGAPALIVLSLSMAEMDHYPDERRQQAERIMAVQSTALAAQNVLLMAHAEGLGGCWVCAPLFCPQVVRAALALPADWEAQGLLTIGYPAEQRTKDREPADSKTVWY